MKDTRERVPKAKDKASKEVLQACVTSDSELKNRFSWLIDVCESSSWQKTYEAAAGSFAKK